MSSSSSSSSSIPLSSMSEQEIIPRLKFIAKLNKGDKIYVKNLCIQPNNFFYRLMRSFYYVDDRANALSFVQSTIRGGFELLQQHIEHDTVFHQQLCRNIFQDLRQAKEGLANLKETYQDDVMFACKVEALMEDIEAKLLELEKHPKFSSI